MPSRVYKTRAMEPARETGRVPTLGEALNEEVVPPKIKKSRRKPSHGTYKRRDMKAEP